jgi:hypothetical protein
MIVEGEERTWHVRPEYELHICRNGLHLVDKKTGKPVHLVRTLEDRRFAGVFVWPVGKGACYLMGDEIKREEH